MNRIQLACYSLIASAFILAALLVTNLGQLSSDANASLVIARDNFTLLTAKTRSAEEALFVLDNASQRLVIYRLDLGRKQLVLAGGVELTELFGRGAQPGRVRR